MVVVLGGAVRGDDFSEAAAVVLRTKTFARTFYISSTLPGRYPG